MKKFILTLMLALGFVSSQVNAEESPFAEPTCAYLDIILPTLLEAQQKGATLEELDSLLKKEATDLFEFAKENAPEDSLALLFMLGSTKYSFDILDEISKQPKQKGQIKVEKHIEQFTKKHKALCIARINGAMES